jgi:hypothetical protein
VNEDHAENLVSAFLGQYGLQTERPSKAERRISKTPDFRVLRNGRFCFFAEVKSVRGDDWLDRELEHASAEQIVGGARRDPVFNRLTGDVHAAVKQFDAVNPKREHPNVLALVNYDEICGLHDLLGVITGNFYADDGSRDPIYRQYSDGRMNSDRLKIDLYLWFGPRDEHHFLFTPINQRHHLALCNWFGKDPAAIESVDA